MGIVRRWPRSVPHALSSAIVRGRTLSQTFSSSITWKAASNSILECFSSVCPKPEPRRPRGVVALAISPPTTAHTDLLPASTRLWIAVFGPRLGQTDNASRRSSWSEGSQRVIHVTSHNPPSLTAANENRTGPIPPSYGFYPVGGIDRWPFMSRDRFADNWIVKRVFSHRAVIRCGSWICSGPRAYVAVHRRSCRSSHLASTFMIPLSERIMVSMGVL